MNIDIAKRYRRLRIAARFVLVLGIAASVIANILYAEPNLISQAISAWAPLAFFLCVDLSSRIPLRNSVRSWLRMIATGSVAAIAAWVSYWHMVDVTARYGQTGITPYLLPISVDGLIVVASICLVEIGHVLDRNETTTVHGNTLTASPDTNPNTDPEPPTHTQANTGPVGNHPMNQSIATLNRPAPETPRPARPNHRQVTLAGTAQQEPLL